MAATDMTVTPLDLEQIVASATTATGLHGFENTGMGAGLKRLIDALNREAGLSPAGIEAQRAGLVNMLCNRLRLDDLFSRHPEILEENIQGPVIIIGLPRSGTTKLQRMLAADTRFQFLPLWKILNPAPLDSARPGEPDPRIAIAEGAMAAMKSHYPDFYAGHPMDALEADEEVFMADLVVRGWNACYSASVPGYEAWLEQQDFTPWYQYLRKLLQLFQWQDGSPQKPWLLKTCEHLPYLNQLFAVFPDATIVHCHRDTLECIPSLGALTATSWKMYADNVDDRQAARFVLNHMAKQMTGYMALRPVLERQHRFVDIGYGEIVGDIAGVMEKIYRASGIELTDGARRAMADWEGSNPIGKHGKHQYSLEGLGLTEDEIRSAFASYLERFGDFMNGKN